MEIFGGFMVMLSFIGFFLTVIWFVMPFVVFSIKGRIDRAVDQLEAIDRRLAAIEARLDQQKQAVMPQTPAVAEDSAHPPQ